ncbi:MAG: type II secretion system protein [Candidatus Staskawiczbacteria bacterium]|nr:type II secretion system protein [Candidatus Staskawiczbacteria bacterium]
MHTNYTNKEIKESRGFTLVEMLIVIAIIALLASIVLYNVAQYINKSKDATINGNLAILVTAGEIWYDKNDSSYAGFCGSDSVTKAFDQAQSDGADEYCNVKDPENTAWVACAKEFVDNLKAYCVDSKGNQKEINNSDCDDVIVNNVSSCCFAGVTNCIP